MVMETVTGPTCAQVTVVGNHVMVGDAVQLSITEVRTSANTTGALPLASKAMVVVVDLVVITGAKASTTFTVNVSTVEFPAASTAVTVMEVEGMSAHV